jgi:hypothetical protein
VAAPPSGGGGRGDCGGPGAPAGRWHRTLAGVARALTAREAAGDGLLYGLLLMLVWGATAPLRGMWQDDVSLLSMALARHHVVGAFAPAGSPLRRLLVLPFILAKVTPHPVLALQLMVGALWLGQALAAGWIAGLLVPGRRVTRLLVVALTLTATGDYLTDSMTAIGYQSGVLGLLLALGCGLRYLERGAGEGEEAGAGDGEGGKAGGMDTGSRAGRITDARGGIASRSSSGGGVGWLVGAAVSLGASLWTVDVAIPALPFLPLLVAWRAGIRPRVRSVALLVAWGIVVAPVAVLEWRFLHDPQGYAVAALRPLPPGEIASRALALWGENFAPWRWVFARPAWYPRPPAAIPAAAMALGGGLAAAAMALRLRRARAAAASEPGSSDARATAATPGLGSRTAAEPAPKAPPTPRLEPAGRVLLLTALLALMALAANAAYASLPFADIHYRTQLASRIWASLALGALAGWAAVRWPRARGAVLAVPVLFVGLGTWGGLERQDLYLATWRLHQRELLSIVTAVPALRPGAVIVLRGEPAHPAFLATQADYLAQSWLALLYHEPATRSLRLAPGRGTGCQPTPRGLDCWHERQAACFAAHTCPADHLDYDSIVVLDFDERAGVYRLRQSLAGDPLATGAAAAAAAYRPGANIQRQPLSAAQRRLLLLN